MKQGASRPGLVLGIHPMDRGFGWALFAGPLAPLDWGVVEERRNKNARCLARIEQLIEQHRPVQIVLEEFEGVAAQRALRIRRLCRSLVDLAKKRGIATRAYSRAEIGAYFASAGAVTRYEIASAIAGRIDAFRHQLPRVRRPWMSEHPRMALFNATAVVLAHFAIRNETR
jgi:hypothetical protein